MNMIRVEGCLWHDRQESEEVQTPSGDDRFIRLMRPVVGISPGTVGKASRPTRNNNRYRLLSGPAAGLMCDIEERAGQTYLTVLAPQPALFTLLSQFAMWLNDGLLAAGHRVTLEVVYDDNIA
ncbi:Secretion system apparatus protein ssaP [Lonsdalea quercina]|uniref:Secretion system apparatus protein ssaP n=1 Tax=Lonsdalea quercina TaxID=71657 RepID=UPI0039758C63